MMLRATMIVLMAALAGPPAAAAVSGATPRAAKADTLRCMSCHGIGGRSVNPTIPSLAGQNANYLMIQLQHFKEGERLNPLMAPIAQSLSTGEMARLAAYFSTLPPGPVDER
jgi:cytochrome c553